MSQSPIDIPFEGDMPVSPPSALDFANYDKVKMIKLSNTEERNKPNNQKIENGTLKNNGHTAVTKT